MITFNNKLAVTPFPTTQTKITVKGGLVDIKQKQELTALTVVYPARGKDFEAEPGDTVYVHGDLCAHQLAKHIFEMEPGKPFILIDAAMIVGGKALIS